jgi:hypothetical protein
MILRRSKTCLMPPIRIVDRPFELLGLFAILGGRTERRERIPLKPVLPQPSRNLHSALKMGKLG